MAGKTVVLLEGEPSKPGDARYVGTLNMAFLEVGHTFFIQEYENVQGLTVNKYHVTAIEHRLVRDIIHGSLMYKEVAAYVNRIEYKPEGG